MVWTWASVLVAIGSWQFVWAFEGKHGYYATRSFQVGGLFWSGDPYLDFT